MSILPPSVGSSSALYCFHGVELLFQREDKDMFSMPNLTSVDRLVPAPAY